MLKLVFHKVITENQSGFMKNMYIMDNVILIQEAIHLSWENMERGVIIKLDMGNVFDRLHCSFLFDVMHKFFFCSSFINWISTCMCNPWIAPLVNGKPTDFFEGSGGLHEVYLISPLIYVIMVESLSRKLETERINGNLEE
jgi:hypothetical protein